MICFDSCHWLMLQPEIPEARALGPQAKPVASPLMAHLCLANCRECVEWSLNSILMHWFVEKKGMHRTFHDMV